MVRSFTLFWAVFIVFVHTTGFGQENIKKLYFNDWQYDLDGSDECQQFFKMQCISPELAQELYYALELIFADDKLVQANELELGQPTPKTLGPNEIGLPFPEVKPQPIYHLYWSADRDAKSYLGGQLPADFDISQYDSLACIQYLGMFSHLDEGFAWLPCDLHLFAPIYQDFNELYIDYSDPMHPVVLNNGFSMFSSAWDKLQRDSRIVYEKVFFSTDRMDDLDGGFGHTGIPDWVQSHVYPISPINHKPMRFLAQLKSNRGVDVIDCSIKEENDFLAYYFEEMNFWGDGDLYIFFEPESSVLCLFIQIT